MQNKKLFILLFFLTSLFKFSQAQSSTDILAYISRYKDLAIAEMKRTGIPAAITLAQGIHETEAGTSELVKRSNNHFGIKCKDDWTGETVRHDDDARGECFRKYAAPEESFRDHSDFLRTRQNYASLFSLDPTDYAAWAYGLKKAGYATNPKYANILIKLIEDYHLEDYTLIALGKMERNNDVAVNKQDNTKDVVAVNNKQTEKPVAVVPENNYPSGEFKINDTRVVFVKQGTAYLTIAQQYEISLARLFEFNDLPQQEIAAFDQLVFIQRKRKTGEHEFHTVQQGETLSSIAQAEAIRLQSLLEYNNLSADMQPAVGETLNLHSRSSSTPRLAEKHANENSNGYSFVNANDTRIQQKNFITHTVLPKETVFSIAKKYNVSANDVMIWNQIQSNDVKVGQSLKIYR
jgi:LysM repeat protein